MEKISKYISYAEAVKSQTAERFGLDNTPNDIELNNMVNVATFIFDDVREHFGVPLYVSSFFRSKKVNEAAGGSKTSQHMTGEAIDIDADVYGGVKNSEIFDYIKNNLEFDQLIAEMVDNKSNIGWVHVSYKVKGNNRRQVLVLFKGNRNYYKFEDEKGFDIRAYV